MIVSKPMLSGGEQVMRGKIVRQLLVDYSFGDLGDGG